MSFKTIQGIISGGRLLTILLTLLFGLLAIRLSYCQPWAARLGQRMYVSRLPFTLLDRIYFSSGVIRVLASHITAL